MIYNWKLKIMYRITHKMKFLDKLIIVKHLNWSLNKCIMWCSLHHLKKRLRIIQNGFNILIECINDQNYISLNEAFAKKGYASITICLYLFILMILHVEEIPAFE